MANENPAVNGPQGEGQEEGRQELKWYVVKVQTMREESIRDSLLRRIKQEGFEDYFGQILIPSEKVVETKGGKKRVIERKLYPGYLFIQMALTEDTWYLVRSTTGVGDFTGAAGRPVPMQEHEVQRLLGLEDARKEGEPAKIKINFSVGDVVKIKEGTFETFEGTIDAIDDASGKVTVLIEIFGRATPVELEYWKVERV